MVRPKFRPIPRERPRLKRNACHIFDLHGCATHSVLRSGRAHGVQLHAREPILIRLLGVRRQEIQHTLDKHLPANPVRHRDHALDLSVVAHADDLLGIPLAHVQALPIETELRPHVVRTRQLPPRIESRPRHQPPHDPVVLRPFAAQHPQFCPDRRHAIRRPRGRPLRSHGPRLRIDRVDPLRLTRAHPKRRALPRERLRFRSR